MARKRKRRKIMNKRLITSILLVVGAFIGAFATLIIEAYMKTQTFNDLLLTAALFIFFIIYVYFLLWMIGYPAKSDMGRKPAKSSMDRKAWSLKKQFKKELKDSPISTTASIISLLGILFLVSLFLMGFFHSTTTYNFPFSASLELKPGWGNAGDMVNYTIEVCNNEISKSPIREIWIYKNENYETFDCVNKDGWDLHILNTVKGETCLYRSVLSIYYIKPGVCETFNFEAYSIENNCDLVWEFEARDINQVWIGFYEFTSIGTCN